MDDLLSNVQTVFWLALGLAGVIALAAVVYILRAASWPLLKAVQWMFAYAPGGRPGDVIAGISYGARMLAWAGVIGLLIWCFFH